MGTVDIDAGDGIGDEVKVDLIEESGGPDGAVKGMGIWGGVERHFHELFYLMGPCCREGKVVWENGEGDGEEDGWEWCFRCQTQEHRVSCSCNCSRNCNGSCSCRCSRMQTWKQAW